MAGERDQPLSRSNAGVKAGATAVAAIVLVPLALAVVMLGAVTGAGASRTCGTAGLPPPSNFQGGNDAPGEGVPPQNFIPAYFAAANQPDAQLGQELGPYVLMAIHETESAFGRSDAPGVKGGINRVGEVSCCKGPFQFYDLPTSSTWLSKSPISGRAYARDGDRDGDVDIYSNFDSMFAAAALLAASGAPAKWRQAIFAYNHADWYVDKVLARARELQAQITPPTAADLPPAPALTDAASADERPSSRTVQVGAARLGAPGDAESGWRGYHGDALQDTAAFAELGYGPGTNESNARNGLLGNLPYGTRLRITYRGKTVEAVKLDVGEGGNTVHGRPRAIALWWQLADELGLRDDDVVTVERVDGGALPDEQPRGMQSAPPSPGCAAPEGVEQVVNATDGGPYQVPLQGNYVISGHFWEWRESYNHEGTDLAAPMGTPIWAAGAGRVIVAGASGGYGNYTCIQHSQSLTSCYAHQSRILVSVGDTVQRGQEIGEVGNTGHSTGPHLHFEMRAGPDQEAPPQCPASYVGIPPEQWCVRGSPGWPA